MEGDKRYQRIKQLQVGAFGIVWLCKDLKTGCEVAMKECDQDEFVKQEIECLKNFKHENIIRMLDSYQTSISQYVILEYGGEDLQTIIEREGALPIDRVKYIMKNVLEGIDYMHSNGYIHRDIKPANIMINDNGDVKIIDFGYCRKVSGRPLTPSRFTNQYAPLDCLLGMEKYNEKMDIWGAGCILGQMLKGSVLFDGDSQLSVIMEIIKVLGTPAQSEWPEMSSIDYFESFQLPEYDSTLLEVLPSDVDQLAVDLLEKLLTVSQSKRISASAALKHKFFS
jgi:serine/threonine protein kinase